MKTKDSLAKFIQEQKSSALGSRPKESEKEKGGELESQRTRERKVSERKRGGKN